MIVVNTSVPANLYLPGEYTVHAEDLVQQDPELALPLLWRIEFRSTLAGSEFEVESPQVLEVVRDSDCSTYDCEFAELAIRVGTNVLTMDAKLPRAFPKYAVALNAG